MNIFVEYDKKNGIFLWDGLLTRHHLRAVRPASSITPNLFLCLYVFRYTFFYFLSILKLLLSANGCCLHTSPFTANYTTFCIAIFRTHTFFFLPRKGIFRGLMQTSLPSVRLLIVCSFVCLCVCICPPLAALHPQQQKQQLGQRSPEKLISCRFLPFCVSCLARGC